MDIAILVTLIVLIIIILWRGLDGNNKNNDKSVELLKADLIELNNSLNNMKDSFGNNLTNLNEKVTEKLEKNNFQLQSSSSRRNGDFDRKIVPIQGCMQKLQA